MKRLTVILSLIALSASNSACSDDCQRLARAQGVSLREVQRAAEHAARAGERP